MKKFDTRQQQIIGDLTEGKSIILTGFQETGKSMIARSILKWCKDKGRKISIYDDIGKFSDKIEDDIQTYETYEERRYHRRKVRRKLVDHAMKKILEVPGQKLVICQYVPEYFLPECGKKGRNTPEYLAIKEKFDKIYYLRRPISKFYEPDMSDSESGSDEDEDE